MVRNCTFSTGFKRFANGGRQAAGRAVTSPSGAPPASEQARAAVLHATSELMGEVGLRSMTTEDIAGRNGVSKATIYKWWPTKYAAAVDAFLSEMLAESADPDTAPRARTSVGRCAT